MLEYMLLGCAIAILILMLLRLNFTIKVSVVVDILKNSGILKVRIAGKRVFSSHFIGNPTKGNILFGKKKSKKPKAELHVNANKKDKRSVAAILSNPMLLCVQVKELSVDLNVGLQNDAFITVMALGSLQTILFAMFSFLRTRFGTHIVENLVPEFSQNRLDISAKATASVSIAGVGIGAIVLMAHKVNKLFKEKRRLHHEHFRKTRKRTASR